MNSFTYLHFAIEKAVILLQISFTTILEGVYFVTIGIKVCGIRISGGQLFAVAAFEASRTYSCDFVDRLACAIRVEVFDLFGCNDRVFIFSSSDTHSLAQGGSDVGTIGKVVLFNSNL